MSSKSATAFNKASAMTDGVYLEKPSAPGERQEKAKYDVSGEDSTLIVKLCQQHLRSVCCEAENRPAHAQCSSTEPAPGVG